MSLHQYSDEDLVRRVMMNARRQVRKHTPLWVVVQDIFGLGSTYAHDLCRQHGLDPDEVRRDDKSVRADVAALINRGTP